ncbi:hypothetical protein GmHk_12G035423 [Glycine max]|nr:hypothetical protein GmHk_12G035423 [Glycine max]
MSNVTAKGSLLRRSDKRFRKKQAQNLLSSRETRQRLELRSASESNAFNKSLSPCLLLFTPFLPIAKAYLFTLLGFSSYWNGFAPKAQQHAPTAKTFILPKNL